MSKTLPLLAVGSFGVHVTSFPSGKFGFVGEIPKKLVGKAYKTEVTAINAFVDWFKSLSQSDQRKHIGDLRNDIFVKIMEA